VVEAPDSGKCDDFACARWFSSARNRRIAAERHVRSVLVIISDVLAHQYAGRKSAPMASTIWCAVHAA
jgi:hypothetical protein